MMTQVSSSGAQSSSDKGVGWDVELHVFACGHGDTLLLRLPDDRWCLIDCCLPKSDKTLQRFFEYLDAHRVKRLEYVFLTHPDRDHCQGMAEVLEHFSKGGREIGFFCDSGPNAKLVQQLHRRVSGKQAYHRLRDILRRLRQSGQLERRYVNEDTRILWAVGKTGTIGLVPLAPSARSLEEAFENDVTKQVMKKQTAAESNGLSIVMVLVVYSAQVAENILLAADAEIPSLTRAMAVWQERVAEEKLRLSDLTGMKVPHHGSIGAHLKSICQSKKPASGNPRFAAVSAGDRGGLPDRRVLDDYLKHDWEVMLTRPMCSAVASVSRRPSRAGDAANRSLNSSGLTTRPGDHDLVFKWRHTGERAFSPDAARLTAATLEQYKTDGKPLT